MCGCGGGGDGVCGWVGVKVPRTSVSQPGSWNANAPATSSTSTSDPSSVYISDRNASASVSSSSSTSEPSSVCISDRATPSVAGAGRSLVGWGASQRSVPAAAG